MHALEKEMAPTPVFLPGGSQGRGSLVDCRLWDRTESDTTEVTWQQQQEFRLEKAMATHSSTLAWKSHGWRSLVDCSPWGREESDTTEQLHLQFSLSCIGEGNGNPLQCSCLENPRDGGAWWAAVYEATQSRTLLKRLSSSSSRT